MQDEVRTKLEHIKTLLSEVSEIIDVTPLPHNGCRPPKRRRV